MYPSSLLISALALLSCISIASATSACTGPHHSQPCECALSHYSCKTNNNECTWASDKCSPSTSTNISIDLPTISLTCGDTISDTYSFRPVEFTLTIPPDAAAPIAINACDSNFNTILSLYRSTPSSDPAILTDDNGCNNELGGSLLVTPHTGLEAGTYHLVLTSDAVPSATASNDALTYSIQIECGEQTSSKPTSSTTPPSKLTDISGHATTTKCDSDCNALNVNLLYYGKLSQYNTDYIYYDTIYLYDQTETTPAKRRTIPPDAAAPIAINACDSNFNTILSLYRSNPSSDPAILTDDNGCNNELGGSLLVTPHTGLEAGTYHLVLTSDAVPSATASNDALTYSIRIDCGEPTTSKPTSSTSAPSKLPDISGDATSTKCDSDCNALNVNLLYYGKLSQYNTDYIYYEALTYSIQIDCGEQTSSKPTSSTTPPSKLTDISGHATTTKCDSDCNALNVNLLYYGKLNQYNTDYIYYDTIYLYDQTETTPAKRRRMAAKSRSMQANPAPHALPDGLLTEGDIVCYTYSIEVNEEMRCVPDIDSVVLGACEADYNRVNANDLEGLVITEFGGDLYSAFSAFGVKEISGLKVDVQVRESSKPVEFTLCMKGVNDGGITSNSVRFNRGREHLSSYTCSNVASQGLPCLREDFTNDRYLNKETLPQSQSGTIFGAETGVAHIDEHPHIRAPSEVFSTFLFTILLIVLTVMVLVSVFYMCVSHEKSWLHVAVDKYRYNLPAAMWTPPDSVYQSGKESAAITSSDISFSSSSMEFEDDDEENNNKPAHPRLPRPKVPDESPTSSNQTSTSSSSLGLGRISIKWSHSAPNLFKFNLKRNRSGIPVERQRLLQEQYMKYYQEDELDEENGNLLGRAVDEFTDDDDADAENHSDDSAENLAQSIKAIERQVVREINERMNSFRGEMQHIPESAHEEEAASVNQLDAETVVINPNVNEQDEAKEEVEREEKEEILYDEEEETAGKMAEEDDEENENENMVNNDNAASSSALLLASPDPVESTASSRRLSSVTTSSDDRGDSGNGMVMLPEYSHYEMKDEQEEQSGGAFFDLGDDVGHHNDVGSPPDVANTGLTANVINVMRYHATTSSTAFFDD
eukprot:CAMPEP_0197073750 /NCGR_PEP_ID=MMETSP1384-20130603/210763_1 /TAXON_ID=29189 /ORGANISM="Ammonia sp." /LENGTH=1102 /DNA_ID=CAMNT_0042512589 /DNA_START=113 /DNA_END=3421 /DNA_ORIENTATION=+